jgi:hypothetical protein
MAEVKNAFIKSKMNKDLDSRLLPAGEYRDGQNIQVSKSEGSDVGALENAVGNIPTTTTTGATSIENVDFSILAGTNPPLPTGTLKSIGIHADTNTADIYVFLTDFTEPTGSFPLTTYSNTSNNYIFSYNTLTNDVTKLVEGSFLNFSTTNPIYGINVIENLLFWTDDRNQPRKININTANGGAYYISEDLISVSKYNPYNVIELYYQDTAAETPYSTPAVPVANPNVNQYVSSAQDVTSKFLPGGGTQPNMYYDPNWPGDPDFLEDKFVTFSYRFRFEDGEYSIMAPFTQEAFIPKQDGYFLTGDEDSTYRSTIVQFMENKVNNVGLYITLPIDDLGNQITGETLRAKVGVEQIDIIYKESDSLTVKVLDSVSSRDFSRQADGSSNVNAFYLYDYQSRKPYKTLPESEIIRVYDKVPVRAFGQEVIGNRIVYSNFQNKHTPPSTIDYDVAVTAKEPFNITGNKASWSTSIIEYPEHTVKQNRNYQVGFVLSDRFGRTSTTILSPISTTLRTDPSTGVIYGGSTYYHPYAPNLGAGLNKVNNFPGDSLKILFNAPIGANEIEGTNLQTGWPGLYNGDTTSSKYNPLGWYSYKIVVKQTEQEYYNVYLPGIMGFYPNVPATPPDPNGKIAFITLLNDNINKVPRDLTEVGPNQKQYRSSVELYGRVTPNTTTANPNAVYGNIPYYPTTATVVAGVPIDITPPTSNIVSTISLQNDFVPQEATIVEYGSIYQTLSNPSMARLTQSGNLIGSLVPANKTTQVNTTLGVYETVPVESLLDIFWETSTTGLISDINQQAGASTSVSDWINFSLNNYTEASVEGSDLTELRFAPGVETGLGLVAMEDSLVTLISVIDGSGTDRIQDFQDIVKTPKNTLVNNQTYGWDSYNINIKNPKKFDINPALNNFTFNFQVTNLDVTPTPDPVDDQVQVPLLNKPPSIDNTPISVSVPNDRTLLPNYPIITTFTGKNGATAMPASVQTQELVWSLKNQVPASPVLEISPSGELTETTDSASGSYSFTLVVNDTNKSSGTMLSETPVTVVFGQQQLNPDFGSLLNRKFAVGMQSSALFWSSDYSNSSLIQTTTSNAPGYLSNGDSWYVSRNAYKNPISSNPILPAGSSSFGLSDTGLQSANIDYREYLSTNIEVGVNDDEYKWINTNYKPNYFDSSVSSTDSSLKEGTAYIKVDFRYKGWPTYTSNSQEDNPRSQEPSENRQIGVGWLAYLQYRSSSSGNWAKAIDVEGKECSFGSTQYNKLGLTGGSGINYKSMGLLSNPTQGLEIRVEGSISRENYAVAANPWIGSPNADTSQNVSSSVASKVFVFGKDQGYETTADKFGEYRLLVRFPETLAGVDRRAVPTPTSNILNPFILRENDNKTGPIITQENIDVRVSYGDFYYKESSTPPSFGYRISKIGKTTAADASDQSPTETVWAREWSFRYVTQFYTDATLATVYTETISNEFYSYSSLTNETTVNRIDGTENASINGLPSPDTSVNTLNALGINNTSDRRWVAQFNSTGKKIAQTAQPCTSTFQQ